MEFTYILLGVIIILILTGKNKLNEKIGRLEFRILDLQHQIMEAIEKKAIQEVKAAPQAEEIPKEPLSPEIPPNPIEDPSTASLYDLLNESVFSGSTGGPVEISTEESAVSDPLSSERTAKPDAVSNRPMMKRMKEKPAEPELSFFERHPDLEKFIGENLINKIGIAILVLAIGYFVKFAIDNNWIGPIGRVGIGVLCGGILISVAHRMRNSYQAFSSVLVGGGLAVLYFTITLAYHQFHLFNQTTSFIILIVITCFAVLLSLLYDKQELAVIALIGGLVSPLMVSGEHANYHALFIYLIILNTGLLFMAYRKSWRILNTAAFGLTAIMFSAILFNLPAGSSGVGFLYASILYLLFFAINVAHNLKENKTFIASDFTILLTNTALYFAAGLYLLTAMHQEQFRGLFALSLGVINLLLSFLLFRNKKVDTNILYLLIGITLTFISLAAPIQLDGHNITLFWAAEAVLLYWLYKKSEIHLMQLASQIIWVLMLISLLMDWAVIYNSAQLTINIIANKGFITTISAAISSYLLFILTRDKNLEIAGTKIRPNIIYKVTAFILLFMSGFLEINHQFLNRYPGTDLNSLYLMFYVPAFVYTFYILSKRLAVMKMSWQVSNVLIAVSIAVYMLLIQFSFYIEHGILVEQNISGFHFSAHWAGAIFTALLLYELILTARRDLPEEFKKLSAWLLAGTVVLFLSMELSLLSNLLFYSKTNTIDHIETIYIKSGLPVLWGLLSFALMWLGMRNKYLMLRIISLTLFSVTLLKLFLFDIQNIPPAGKIAAFFCLGILLLIISFMYQKVKKIIVADELPQTVADEPSKED